MITTLLILDTLSVCVHRRIAWGGITQYEQLTIRSVVVVASSTSNEKVDRVSQ